MRRLILLLLTVAALAGAGRAAAGTVNVTIGKDGFTPKAVTVGQNDTVVWTNGDTSNHQIVADKGQFTSAVLHQGETFSYTFQSTGKVPYHDGLDKRLKGTVEVKGANAKAAPESVTMAAPATAVVYGRTVTLSGAVSTQRAGETVKILARSFGQNSFAQIAAVTTAATGAWSYAAKPTIQTSYQASSPKATSGTVTIGVRPLVTFHVLTGRRFSTKAVAARPFAGRIVLLQRRSAFGQWVTIKRVRLGTGSQAVFRVTLPKGTSTLRLSMSVNQAGAGYLAGISRTIVYHRA